VIVGALPVIATALVTARERRCPSRPTRRSAMQPTRCACCAATTPPTPDEAAALDAYLVTVCDHGMNASTFTARVVASTASRSVRAVTAGYCALTGPLHGGAPEPVLEMLDAIGTRERIKPWIDAALARGERLMGFGHRIYRVRDPRADVLKSVVESSAEHAAISFRRRSRSGAREALRRNRKPDRPLDTNVEFFTAILLDALRFRGRPSRRSSRSRAFRPAGPRMPANSSDDLVSRPCQIGQAKETSRKSVISDRYEWPERARLIDPGVAIVGRSPDSRFLRLVSRGEPPFARYAGPRLQVMEMTDGTLLEDLPPGAPEIAAPPHATGFVRRRITALSRIVPGIFGIHQRAAARIDRARTVPRGAGHLRGVQNGSVHVGDNETIVRVGPWSVAMGIQRHKQYLAIRQKARAKDGEFCEGPQPDGLPAESQIFRNCDPAEGAGDDGVGEARVFGIRVLGKRMDAAARHLRHAQADDRASRSESVRKDRLICLFGNSSPSHADTGNQIGDLILPAAR
jgi:hypothetical protein